MSDKEKKRAEMEEKLKTLLRVCLSDGAYERMMNVRVANKQLYVTAAQTLFAYYKKLGRKLDESEVLSVLRTIKYQTDKNTSIKFQRK